MIVIDIKMNVKGSINMLLNLWETVLIIQRSYPSIMSIQLLRLLRAFHCIIVLRMNWSILALEVSNWKCNLLSSRMHMLNYRELMKNCRRGIWICRISIVSRGSNWQDCKVIMRVVKWNWMSYAIDSMRNSRRGRDSCLRGKLKFLCLVHRMNLWRMSWRVFNKSMRMIFWE